MESYNGGFDDYLAVKHKKEAAEQQLIELEKQEKAKHFPVVKIIPILLKE